MKRLAGVWLQMPAEAAGYSWFWTGTEVLWKARVQTENIKYF